MNNDIDCEESPKPGNYGGLQVLTVAFQSSRRHLLEDDYLPSDFEPPGILFTQPVPDFSSPKHVPLIIFIGATPATVSHLGIGFRGYPAGTSLAQLRVSKVLRLPHGIRLTSIIEATSETYRKRASAAIRKASLIPPRTSAAVLDAFLSLSPSAKDFIDTAVNRREQVSTADTLSVQLVRQEHHDAVLTALAFAGIDRSFIKNSADEESAGSGWFLESIDATRVREDPMIIHDAGSVPGMELRKANIHGKRFSDGKVDLTVLLINRQPLEELTGADLIYYNETFKTFILIQYKALEEEGSAHVFRLPNENLEKEINRMNAILVELAKHIDKTAEPKGFRISTNPFFLKFCPRAAKAASATDLFKGFYIPLEYYDSLAASKDLDGPKGGKRLSYDNVQRWLTNTDFIPLVRNGWVGTTPAQSSFLQEVVEQTLAAGRAVTFASVSKAS
jgi:hypothetical protein